jgi:hypothetical protein
MLTMNSVGESCFAAPILSILRLIVKLKEHLRIFCINYIKLLTWRIFSIINVLVLREPQWSKL